MSKSTRIILYVGDQRDIFLLICSYFKERDDNFTTYDCRQVTSGQECLEVLESELDALVIMDFCEVEDPIQFMQPLTIFKRWKTKASVAVGGIFNNKKQIKESEVLFGLGLNYAYIKGGDDVQALNSLFYIAYEDASPCLDYALAKGFKLPFRPKSLGYISEFTTNSFLVDKDFKSLNEEVEMELDLFEDFTATKFSLADEYDMGARFNTLYSAHLQIEFASGWEADENAMFEDTFTSWIGMNQDSFIEKKGSVLIYGKRRGLGILLSSMANEYPDIDFHLIEEFEEDNQEMIKIAPDLVFFQMEDEQSFHDLERMLIQMSYERVLNPSIVAVFGHPSSTDALRKLYGRGNLIATTYDIDERLGHGMVERMQAVKKGQDIFRFKTKDQRLKAYFPLDAQITSLTENEITFMTTEELPYYSVVKVSVPLDLYAVIVPSLKKLSPNIHGHHYMGLICGVESFEYNTLRKLVNHIIDNGIEEWSNDSFDLGDPKTIAEIEARPEEDALDEPQENKRPDRVERHKSKNKLAKL